MNEGFNHRSMSAFEQDQRYVGLCAAEHLGYLSLRHGSAKPSDLCHFFGGQKLLEERNKTHVDSMLLIKPIICPLEIGCKGVRLNPINMINHRKVGGVGYECNRDDAMDARCFAFPSAEEIDLRVPNLAHAMSEDFSVASLGSARSHPHSVNTSYLPEVADFIEADEVCDGSPFFDESDIHTTGCPSGNVGSTIKNPSHATTFGGFAIMAASSDTYNRRLRFL